MMSYPILKNTLKTPPPYKDVTGPSHTYTWSSATFTHGPQKPPLKCHPFFEGIEQVRSTWNQEHPLG